MIKKATRCPLLLILLITAAYARESAAMRPFHRGRARRLIHTNNGAFLAHAYVSSAPFIDANIATMLTHMQMDYSTNRLFVICGGINGSGRLANGPAAVPQVVRFLNAIAAWEASHREHRFKMFAYLSGSLSRRSANFIDVGNASVRSSIAAESARFTSSSVSGSYVAGAARTFDGVFIDFEPAGSVGSTGNTLFENLTLLMDEVHRAIGPKKLTAFSAPKYDSSESSLWSWNSSLYYGMAGHVDVLVVMEYDTRLTSGDDYQSWIEAQTVSILKAASGEYWTDGAHPEHASSAQVLFAVPAYPNKPPNHFASVENIQVAIPGIKAGLKGLDARALRLFGAAIIYLTTDGSGTDGYASYSTDWENFVKKW